MEFVEIIICLRRLHSVRGDPPRQRWARVLHFLAGKKWRKEPTKGFLPLETPDARESLSIIQHSTESLVCGLGPTGSMYARPPLRGGSHRTESALAAVSACAVSFLRSGVVCEAGE